MARALLLNPLLVLLVAAAGAGACRLAGVNCHGRDLAAAALAATGAAEVAIGLAWLRSRQAGLVDVAQATLLALATHLLAMLALSALIFFAARLDVAFAWWSLTMFWTTLIGVSIVMVRAVREAADAAASANRAAAETAGDARQPAPAPR